MKKQDTIQSLWERPQ